ncbi:MAG: EAL domain-containing protein [Thiomicrorhabdus sp.]|nr:EAL domain-containing protein [Thiomicrorhabdus sp.]
MFSLKRFFTAMFVIVVVGLYTSFLAYYLDEQETKAKIINSDFHRVLNETSYTISTQLNDLKQINNFKSLLNRKVAQNHLISAMMIVKGNQILLTTDPSHKTLPKTTFKHTSVQNPSHKDILSISVQELEFEVYQQSRAVTLSVLLFSNSAEINTYFSETSNQYILTLILPTFIIALLLYWLLRVYFMQPLEQLNKFAYYHDRIPDPLKIRELEAIRSSMLQTFQLLAEESKALYRSARTDALSDLPNRYQLNERLAWLINECKSNKKEFAYLFCDLDNFKNINDTLGHDAGDEIVINVAKIMRSKLRGYDIIARVGGDEFVILIDKYHNHIELNHIIEKVLAAISQDQLVRNQIINVSASIGVAFYPKDGTNAQTLMKNADIAMYEAKKLGKNQHHYFTEELNSKILREVQVEAELKQAIQNKEFELYYQPKVSTKNQKIYGLECLIRWNHPTKGLISPFDFIPIAEQSGLIISIGDWVLEEAMKTQIKWKTDYGICLPISVNVSAMQFNQRNFFSKLQELIYKLDFNPRELDIEVTESVLMENKERHLVTLQKLRGIGISISLDDFGTGYSSLAYLKTFPINIIKIDKSFIDDYQTHSGAIFIETIINMAHNLKMSVVAEGVETAEQLQFLTSLKCECFQGYLCSKPLPNDQFIELVQKCTADSSVP